MKCQQCGKSHSITINHKKYCANCGTSLSGGKPLVKKTKNKAVLDLTGHGSKVRPPGLNHQIAPDRRRQAAQSIHGIQRHSSAKTSFNSLHSLSHKRQERAATVKKSRHISKFSNAKPTADTANDLPVTPMTPHRSYAVGAVPKQKQVAMGMAKHHPRSAAHIMNSYGHSATAKPKKRFKRVRRAASAFKRRPRFATTMAVAASALILGAYITYLNYPNISLRVAASRAGLDAQVPRYTPPGYSFKGPVAYGPGQITVAFNSNSDSGNLNVTQRRTDWDSQTLLENYVHPKTDKQPLTYQENGLTIYLYNSNQAAWVNSGILYTIEGNTNLNPEQILKIASSL